MSAADLISALRKHGWRIATAESCTGGLLGGALTEMAGASDVYEGGFVTYSNGAKMTELGVTRDALNRFGAVSETVAGEMALGARKRLSVDLALSVTGVAGPGGSQAKPEGRVCFGVTSAQGTQTETVEFGALGRDKVRRAAVDHAIKLAITTCHQVNYPPGGVTQ